MLGFGSIGQFSLGQFEQLASVASQTLTASASIAVSGAAKGSAAVAGQVLSDASTIAVSGAAKGSAAVGGQVLTNTASVIAGAVIGAAAAPGDLVSATCSIESGGAAANDNTAGDGSIGWWGPVAYPRIQRHAEAAGADLGVAILLIPGGATVGPDEELALLGAVLDLDFLAAA